MRMRTLWTGAVALSLLGGLSAQTAKDDFQREGKGKARAEKSALEGKTPPKLQVDGWLNTDGKPLQLAKLEGKVIVLKFWGVW